MTVRPALVERERDELSPGCGSGRESLLGRLTHRLHRARPRLGLVEREIFAEVPPRVEYRSTPLGKSLAGPVLAIAEWASAHQAEISANRDRYDEATD